MSGCRLLVAGTSCFDYVPKCCSVLLLLSAILSQSWEPVQASYQQSRWNWRNPWNLFESSESPADGCRCPTWRAGCEIIKTQRVALKSDHWGDFFLTCSSIREILYLQNKKEIQQTEPRSLVLLMVVWKYLRVVIRPWFTVDFLQTATQILFFCFQSHNFWVFKSRVSTAPDKQTQITACWYTDSHLSTAETHNAPGGQLIIGFDF